MPIYKTPTEGSGTKDEPTRAAHNDEHSADPANYQTHIRQDYSYVAADVEIGTFEELVDDDSADVETVDAVPDVDDPFPPEREE